MIDFHCHLDLYSNPAEIVSECVGRGLYVLSVTTTPSAWEGTSALAANAPRIRTGLGLHPEIAHLREFELPLFRSLIGKTAYVGEIGLDGSPALKPHWQTQLSVFDQILDACQQAGGRILSVHSRRAAGAVLDRLSEYPAAGLPILHWFSGGRRELSRAIDMGCWFSVGPAMLRTEKGRSLASAMPMDRLLLESDGPFAQIEGRPALPWDAAEAIAPLAEIFDQNVVELSGLLRHNLRRLGAISDDLFSTASRVESNS